MKASRCYGWGSFCGAVRARAEGGKGDGERGPVQPELRDFWVWREYRIPECHEGVDVFCLRFHATSHSVVWTGVRRSRRTMIVKLTYDCCETIWATPK
jgi:hypothetical protein